jgi:hypothetical protein
MFDHLKTITTLINFDITNGPFLTGGYLTWLIESQYNVPNWMPNDIDICCTTIEQFDQVKQVLEPLATNTRVSNWMNSNSTYWTIDDFQFQAFVHTTSKKRIDWADFSITAIASDGVNFLMLDNTAYDIEHKILRINFNNWQQLNLSTSAQLDRYNKYINRGYYPSIK